MTDVRDTAFGWEERWGGAIQRYQRGVTLGLGEEAIVFEVKDDGSVKVETECTQNTYSRETVLKFLKLFVAKLAETEG